MGCECWVNQSGNLCLDFVIPRVPYLLKNSSHNQDFSIFSALCKQKISFLGQHSPFFSHEHQLELPNLPFLLRGAIHFWLNFSRKDVKIRAESTSAEAGVEN
jgi:hypothetical protein